MGKKDHDLVTKSIVRMNSLSMNLWRKKKLTLVLLLYLKLPAKSTATMLTRSRHFRSISMYRKVTMYRQGYPNSVLGLCWRSWKVSFLDKEWLLKVPGKNAWGRINKCFLEDKKHLHHDLQRIFINTFQRKQ